MPCCIVAFSVACVHILLRACSFSRLLTLAFLLSRYISCSRFLSPPQCDDGNALSSDGCSSSCTIEEGFRCEARAHLPDECTCELGAAQCCVRRYGKCILANDKSCTADCLTNLTLCQRAAHEETSASSSSAVPPNHSGYDLDLWAEAEPLQCVYLCRFSELSPR